MYTCWCRRSVLCACFTNDTSLIMGRGGGINTSIALLLTCDGLAHSDRYQCSLCCHHKHQRQITSSYVSVAIFGSRARLVLSPNPPSLPYATKAEEKREGERSQALPTFMWNVSWGSTVGRNGGNPHSQNLRSIQSISHDSGAEAAITAATHISSPC